MSVPDSRPSGRFVYRVVVVRGQHHSQRLYLTRRGAEQRAQRERDGYERAVPADFDQYDTEQVPPADTVTIEQSNPITWPV